MSYVSITRCATCSYDSSHIIYLLKNKLIKINELTKYLSRPCCLINIKGQYQVSKTYGVPMNISIIRKGQDIRPI